MTAAENAAYGFRLRVFKARSIRGLLDVIPSQDLRFTGLTVGWVGVGFIRAVSRRSK